MCGIVGAKSDEAERKVLEGLKRLEYRGYDSAGIALQGNPSVKVEKKVGTVEDLNLKDRESKTGIGHTRWATHGGVTDENAHPHTDCEEKIAVVHNGIIQNYEELKVELEEKGHEFKSETDSEVIPHLIEENLREKSLEQTLSEIEQRLEGSYAIAGILDDGRMFAIRKDSPLVVGIKDGEYYLGSDVTAFLQYTDQAIFLENGDKVVIDDEVKIMNGPEVVQREVQEIEWDAEQASKAGYDHFMEKEIYQQKKTIKRAAFQDKSDLLKAREMIEEAENIYLTGCGTASYAAMLGAKYLRESGTKAVVEQSHELEYRSSEITEDDLVIAVSQSGETADLLSMLKKTDADLLSVVNVVGSTLDRNSDHSLYANAGPEIGVASTKAFTAQITVLKLIAAAVKGEIKEKRNSLIKTAEKVDKVLENNKDEIENISNYFSEKDDVYFIGRNKGKEVALESALKLKELSYIHSEGFAGGEFKHGTLALIEDGVPVVAFLDHEHEEVMSNMIEAKSRGADIIGVGSEREDLDFFIEIPEDENNEIIEIVPFQMIAYETSVMKGNNPDRPRNLAKSVTVK